MLVTANGPAARGALLGGLLGLASMLPADPLLTRSRLVVLADVSANGRRLGWSEARMVDGLRLALGLSPMAAHRLYHRLTRQQAVATIGGLAQEHLDRSFANRSPVKVRINVEDLAAWESGQARVPAVLLNAVCEAYRTRPDRIGYPDHTPPELRQ